MGRKTYVVSLPMEWVRRYNLNKGEELMIAEKENSLLITNPSQATKKSIEVKVEDKKMLRQYARELYRQGYDEITFIAKNISLDLEKAIHQLPGMEIIEETTNYCRLKSFTLGENNDFDNLLRRLFFILSNVKQKSKAELQSTKENAFKLLNYLYRLLYKQEMGSHQKTLILVSLLNELETLLQTGEKNSLENLYSQYYNFTKESSLEGTKISQIAFALHLENSLSEKIKSQEIL